MDIDQDLLKHIDQVNLPIPIELVEEIMQEVGCNTSDPRCAKLLAADCHKFLTDILNDIIDVSNVKPTPQLNPKHREQKMNLNVRDLQEALMEKGIDVNKPAFYLDRPSK